MARVVAAFACAWSLWSSSSQAADVDDQVDTKARAFASVDANAAKMRSINRDLWTYAETSLEEKRSSQALQQWLRASGFRIQADLGGMPTAFVASYGSGAPVIGIIAEFDALPGLSQEATPERKPRAGATAGHACGHSIFGTASTAAAIAVQKAIASGDIKGTVRLYGTPAEELGIGKPKLIDAGFIKDADIVLAWHPRDVTHADFQYTKALISARFRFEGQAAHASASPDRGRSALDAAELMSVGVNYMREHIKGDVRVHSVISDGGNVPNVVPATAESWYFVRANRHADAATVFAWVKEIASAAAQMTQTRVAEVKIETDLKEVLPNRTLAEVLQRNLVAVGPPVFSAAEKEFARATQKELASRPALALAERIVPLPAAPAQLDSSTDLGAVSWIVPVGSLSVASYTSGAASHTWQVVACTGMSIGDKAMAVAAKTLAASAIDLYVAPELIAKAKADFEAIRATDGEGGQRRTATKEQ